MRKFLRILLLTAVLAGALCVSALAAEPTEAGRLWHDDGDGHHRHAPEGRWHGH